ncbi:hypothetical protein l13_02080 [Neisseria weaveri ATCC 51223]|nr:hypothetical protein l13_02080 [Neisseria weaveri ATCC 51223]
MARGVFRHGGHAAFVLVENDFIAVFIHGCALLRRGMLQFWIRQHRFICVFFSDGLFENAAGRLKIMCCL